MQAASLHPQWRRARVTAIKDKPDPQTPPPYVSRARPRARRGLSRHWLEASSVTIDGQRFLGGTLWFGRAAGQLPQRHHLSDFTAIADFEPWVYGAHERFLAFLDRELRETDVVVSHHLPALACVAAKWSNSGLNPFFVHDLTALIRARAPRLWIHGHTHEPVDVRGGATRILANPFGYRGQEEQPAFQPALRVEVGG